MSNYDLTPDTLKQQHANAITKGDTFKPQGVSEQRALTYLDSDEGAMYWWRVAQGFEPNTPSQDITDRAVVQLKSGLETPPHGNHRHQRDARQVRC